MMSAVSIAATVTVPTTEETTNAPTKSFSTASGMFGAFEVASNPTELRPNKIAKPSMLTRTFEMRGFALSRSEAGCSCTGSCTAQTFILRWTRLLGAAVNLFRVEVSGSLCVAVKEEPRDRGATPVKAVELLMLFFIVSSDPAEASAEEASTQMTTQVALANCRCMGNA